MKQKLMKIVEEKQVWGAYLTDFQVKKVTKIIKSIIEFSPLRLNNYLKIKNWSQS